MALALKGILGRKLGMTQMFDEQGAAVAVTLLQAGPCVVVQRKTSDHDGYEALQLGFGALVTRGDHPSKAINKPEAGHFARAGVAPHRRLMEFRMVDCEQWQVGQTVDTSLFQVGERLDVCGITKGKGFAGGVKRHGFRGGPATHGSMFHRKPASGGATTPARVFKGSRKPGHMGAVQVTVKGLAVLHVDAEKNLLAVKGSVPGAPGSLVKITVSAKAGMAKSSAVAHG